MIKKAAQETAKEATKETIIIREEAMLKETEMIKEAAKEAARKATNEAEKIKEAAREATKDAIEETTRETVMLEEAKREAARIRETANKATKEAAMFEETREEARMIREAARGATRIKEAENEAMIFNQAAKEATREAAMVKETAKEVIREATRIKEAAMLKKPIKEIGTKKIGTKENIEIKVIEKRDYIVRIKGEYPFIINQMAEFQNGVKGIVIKASNDIADIALLEDSLVQQVITGDLVSMLPNEIFIKPHTKMLGSIINIYGESVYGNIKEVEMSEIPSMPIFRMARPIYSRDYVNRPLYTGLTALD